jgi:acyl carrier protein
VSILARRSRIAKEQITPDTRLVEDLKLDGDDAVDALLEISKKCAIDVSRFESTRYFRSEPTLLALLPFLPSQRKRAEPKQPLTVGDLINAVRRGSLQSQ